MTLNFLLCFSLAGIIPFIIYTAIAII